MKVITLDSCHINARIVIVRILWRCTMGQNKRKHRINSHPIIHHPTSERTSEWPSTYDPYVSILVCSRPQCAPSPTPTSISVSVTLPHLRLGWSPRLVAFFLDVVGGFGIYKERLSLLMPQNSLKASSLGTATAIGGSGSKQQAASRLQQQLLLFRDRALGVGQLDDGTPPLAGITQLDSFLRVLSDLVHARVSVRCLDVIVSSSARVGVRVRLDEVGVVVETGKRVGAGVKGLIVVKLMPEDLERAVDCVPAARVRGVVFARVDDINVKAEGY